MSKADSGRALSGTVGVVLVAFAAVVAAAVGGMVVADGGDPTADEILGDARERYASADTVAGTAVVTVENDTIRRSAEVTFAVTDDNRSRVAVTAANRTAVAGSNGSVAWIHLEDAGLTRVVDVSGHEAGTERWNASDPGNLTASLHERMAALRERYGEEFPAVAPRNASDGAWRPDADDGAWQPNASHGWNRSDLRPLAWAWTPENTTAERVGTRTVDGTEAHLIEIEPAGDREGVVRVWIGTDDPTVLKAQFAAGEWTATVRYTDVRFDVPLADSTFRPPGDVPAGATTTDSRADLQAATTFDLPALPAGYTFTTGSTVAYGNVTVAIQEYAGPVNATLATTPADRLPTAGESADARANATTVELAGVTATVSETDRGVVVTWEANGLRNAVVVDGSRETAVSVAASAIEAS